MRYRPIRFIQSSYKSRKHGVTIVDVCRDIGVEVEPRLTWAVGNRVRELWEQRHGGLPEKELRRKTAGKGSHCLAVYPEHWRNDIETIIRLHETMERSQGDLFDE